MCKLFAITTLPPMDWDKTRTAVFAAMAKTEKDGLGAAWSTPEDNKLGRIRASGPEAVNGGLAPFCEGFVKLENLPFDGGPAILHGRTATTPCGLSNTHPFIMRDKGRILALAHNGVVHSEKYKIRTGGCDSELILEAFNAGGMAEVAKRIDGYYAVLLLEKTASRTLLHVIRDSSASLYVGKIGEAWAFATTMELLEVAGARIVSPFRRNTHAVFEGNKMIRCKQFTPAVKTYGFGEGFHRSPTGAPYVTQMTAAANKAFAGQQFALDLEAQEEARLQAALEKYEREKAHGGRTVSDFPLDDGDTAAEWPATRHVTD